MKLTAKQEEGLKIAIARHKAGEKYTVISGYAGSGKTTLIKFIIEALDVSEDRVCFATFTGKAAEVLRKKGNKNVSTLHRLLYDSYPKPGGGFFRKPKVSLGYDIIVVDEVSMVPKELMDLLFRYRTYVICLGDPFQLPPVAKEAKDSDNHLLDNPHIFLDEIMRQAKESEIIRLTMDIREQKPISLYKGNEVQIFPAISLADTSMLDWADQIIVAKNATRYNINDRMRKFYNRGAAPETGDKVICRRNYWDDLSETHHDPLINGSIGYLKNPFPTFRIIPRWLYTTVQRFDVIQSDIEFEDDYFAQVEISKSFLVDKKECCDWRDSYKIGKAKPRIGDIIPRNFEYGYAITCHAAQGSQWDNVLVVEENFPWVKEDHARWLYTAATRASNKLVIVQNN